MTAAVSISPSVGASAAALASAEDAYDAGVGVIAVVAGAIVVLLVAWLVHRQYRASKRRRARHSARQRAATHRRSPLYEQRQMPTFGEGRDPRETNPDRPPPGAG